MDTEHAKQYRIQDRSLQNHNSFFNSLLINQCLAFDGGDSDRCIIGKQIEMYQKFMNFTTRMSHITEPFALGTIIMVNKILDIN